MKLYTSLVAERAGLRKGIIYLLASSTLTNVVLALAFVLHRPETRTIIIPPTLAAEREMWSFDDRGPSSDYIERFALSILSHAASVTPSTVEGARLAILKHADPSVYGEIESTFILEGERIRKDRTSTVFYPEQAVVDRDTLTVTVSGMQKLLVGSTVTSERPKTWTMRFRYDAGRLFLLSITDRQQNAKRSS